MSTIELGNVSKLSFNWMCTAEGIFCFCVEAHFQNETKQTKLLLLSLWLLWFVIIIIVIVIISYDYDYDFMIIIEDINRWVGIRIKFVPVVCVHCFFVWFCKCRIYKPETILEYVLDLYIHIPDRKKSCCFLLIHKIHNIYIIYILAQGANNYELQ